MCIRDSVRALEEPVRQIAENAGFEGSVVVAQVKESPEGTGFNASTEEYVDMIGAGIVDPAKVTRSALQNASSASAMLLTTEAGITDIPADEPAMPPMGGGCLLYTSNPRKFLKKLFWIFLERVSSCPMTGIFLIGSRPGSWN